MNQTLTCHRKKIAILCLACLLLMLGLAGRLFFLMVFRSVHYSEMAEDLHQRERTLKAARGRILDRNGTVIADNRAVCTISVIRSQITDPEAVIRLLTEELELDEAEVRRKVEKRSSREIIRTNVDKETGDRIRGQRLAGVKVDEDYKRYYPYGSLASRVLGFTGADNQGIIGLEVQYESWLKGTPGRILTMTDAAGVELDGMPEDRVEPEAGADLVTSLDVNIQLYAQQAAWKVMQEKEAKQVSIVVMNPKNGEILAMVSVPEFNLNAPFSLPEEAGASSEASGLSTEERLNRMWRNPVINDTYEPGSTFKIVTAAAGLEEGCVTLEDHFFCPGYRIVEDRKIRCHKTGGHGSETFLQGAMNSCNPVFIDVGQKLGAEAYCRYFRQFGLLGKTGVDLPGEASTIMHREEDMGLVELATVSFGQSFQITPLQLITTVSSVINGGRRVTPHLALRTEAQEGSRIREFDWPLGETILSEETSASMRFILEQVVAEGSGKKAALPGWRIGGKTATSEKLPRSRKKYISSFIGFAPAQDPEVIALITIDEPSGVYYGGTIAAPVIGSLFENILPYLGIRQEEAAGENS